MPVLADIESASRCARRDDASSSGRCLRRCGLQAGGFARGASGRGRRDECSRDKAHRGCGRLLGVERFVLFSTNKAVSRRTCSADESCRGVDRRDGGSRGAAPTLPSVRLGNVIDSAGSSAALPAAARARRPITVTHPETTRYLMTATEAAGLAVVAGALGDPHGNFWLDWSPQCAFWISPAARTGRLSRDRDRLRRLGRGRKAPRATVLEQRRCRRDALRARFKSITEQVDPAWL